MAAFSVTGVSGLGDSNGKYKPQNNCSCSCCCGPSKDKEKNKKIKNSCHTRYKCFNSNSTVKINTGNFKIKIC